MTYYANHPIRFAGVSMVTATPGSNDPEVGTVITEGDEEYIFVYNTGNSQISVGQGAVVSAVTGYSVTVSSTSQVDLPVGVVKHSTLTTGTYGFLLTKGFGKYAVTANGPIVAAGDGLTLGADGYWATKLVTTAYSQSVMPSIFGKAVVATASAGVGEAYFRVR